MSFSKDLELARKAEQYQNELYQDLLPIADIIRYQQEDEGDRHVMDREHHIDVVLKLSNGAKLMGQEKALRNKFAKYNTFTIEFYQNRHTKERGEFFNLGAQFYLHGYWNSQESGFCKWYLIRVFDFMNWLKEKSIEELEAQTRAPGSSNATFYYMDYEDIPNEFIYASHKNPNPQSIIQKKQDNGQNSLSDYGGVNQ